VTDTVPDRRLAVAMANRLSGCRYRDLLRLARFLKIKKPTKMKRERLEMEVRFRVYPEEYDYMVVD
jgi:hypothetical protein